MVLTIIVMTIVEDIDMLKERRLICTKILFLILKII